MSQGSASKSARKGGVSVYGLGPFLATLYKKRWTRLLSTADEVREFLKENHAV
jgi:hypothetical protein